MVAKHLVSTVDRVSAGCDIVKNISITGVCGQNTHIARSSILTGLLCACRIVLETGDAFAKSNL